MPYTRTIVCLANSKKIGGRCVAGREWDGNKFGDWIRPVSSLEKGEIHAERFCENADRRDPMLLDILEIPFLEAKPTHNQIENHLIDPQQSWRYRGSITVEQLVPAVEQVNGTIWSNGNSTYNGLNDAISVNVATSLPNSLMLIQPESLDAVVSVEGAAFGNPKRKVRGAFSIAGANYIFSITDPLILAALAAEPDGAAVVYDHPILCISISEVFEKQNACYKLIAGVIQTN